MSESIEFPPALRDYILRSNIALAVSETGDDTPLILVNEAFCTLTGYGSAEVVGRNCRFLQGEATTEEARQALHDFVDGAGPDSGRFPILNYRKDGTAFHNFVFMTRLKDRRGVTRYILASQFDMSRALRVARAKDNDAELTRALSDVDQIGRNFGLTVINSAELISESIATLARLALDDES